MKDFGKRLQALIEQRYGNVNKFCKREGFTPAEIGRYINGSYPSAMNLIALSDSLKVSADYLLRGQEFAGRR